MILDMNPIRVGEVIFESMSSQIFPPIQPADIGWPTGNRKKLSSCQAQLGQATCLAVASFLSISCGQSYVRRLYIVPTHIADRPEIHHFTVVRVKTT